jgi:hypothetical protein
LGQLQRYNGVDIVQGKHYIKLNNPTYINKIVKEHEWMIQPGVTTNLPLPMNDDKEYIKKIEQAIPPTSQKEKIDLQIQMNFNYRQTMDYVFLGFLGVHYFQNKFSKFLVSHAHIHTTR